MKKNALKIFNSASKNHYDSFQKVLSNACNIEDCSERLILNNFSKAVTEIPLIYYIDL